MRLKHACAVILLCLLTSCASKPTLPGRWASTEFIGQSSGFSGLTLDLGADGKYTLAGQSSDGRTVSTIQGTWKKQSEQKLVLTPTQGQARYVQVEERSLLLVGDGGSVRFGKQK